VSDSSSLAYFRERTCELDIGAFLHCKDSKICFVDLAYGRGGQIAARKPNVACHSVFSGPQKCSGKSSNLKVPPASRSKY